jgi:hypothetical protein
MEKTERKKRREGKEEKKEEEEKRKKRRINLRLPTFLSRYFFYLFRELSYDLLSYDLCFKK